MSYCENIDNGYTLETEIRVNEKPALTSCFFSFSKLFHPSFTLYFRASWCPKDLKNYSESMIEIATLWQVTDNI